MHGITERFQEGLRILPVRILRGGEFDEDVLRLILGNVRLPDILRGDLTAQRNANFVGAQRMAKLYEEHGLDADGPRGGRDPRPLGSSACAS